MPVDINEVQYRILIFGGNGQTLVQNYDWKKVTCIYLVTNLCVIAMSVF